MIEVPVPGTVEQALSECLTKGLAVRSERGLAGRPGSHHYHLALPGKPGTLELSAWQGKVWFAVNERRDCGWVSDFAREVAAAVGHAESGERQGDPAT
jgi:hypothetical protein